MMRLGLGLGLSLGMGLSVRMGRLVLNHLSLLSLQQPLLVMVRRGGVFSRGGRSCRWSERMSVHVRGSLSSLLLSGVGLVLVQLLVVRRRVLVRSGRTSRGFRHQATVRSLGL